MKKKITLYIEDNYIIYCIMKKKYLIRYVTVCGNFI